jgi:hypothetical protein
MAFMAVSSFDEATTTTSLHGSQNLKNRHNLAIDEINRGVWEP